jgi:UDP-N-acetylglucosamine 2-epimerase (non-hydrolysing)
VAAEASARRRHRIVSIVGTRPEAIKMTPVVRELAAREGVSQQLVLTGQHEGLARYFALPASRLIELPYDPRGRTPPRLRETLHAILSSYLRRERVDLVLVHGDTASAIAGALAARDCEVPVGHVEAGLRSFDLRQPWPEEGNRVAIDCLSDLLFAPTQAAAANLRADWRVKGEIFVTGNSGIDALFQALGAEPAARAGESGRRVILATCHRKENRGAPTRAVCAALKRLVEELPVEVVMPLHPNRHVRRELQDLLAGVPHIKLIEPLDYGEMVRLMARCWAIVTDSGGLQEEGPALGKPVLVLRNVTERGEGLAGAGLELVGTDEERIVAAVRALFEDAEHYARMSRPSLPFGDGRAAPRIVDGIERWLLNRRRASAGQAAAHAPRVFRPGAR